MQEYKIVSYLVGFISGLVAGASFILSVKMSITALEQNKESLEDLTKFNIITSEGPYLRYTLGAATSITFLLVFLSVSEL